ncbi:MAG: hypothetical protein NT132_06850 [Microbacterium sp.]|uniref:hypothetical protein n=1 Tax=Microbacterium sp. TaxID=51671 RepID=UPI002629DFDF|nr:hypothetical protein [Microbacterium sp.]MCX6502107.1 hypothetical protein [Microbacterium sp.]
MNTLHVSGSAPTQVRARPPVTMTTDHSAHRPSLLERSAMRLGLWLLLWGRHRSQRRVDRDAHARYLLAEQVRHERERSDAYAAFSLPPR